MKLVLIGLAGCAVMAAPAFAQTSTKKDTAVIQDRRTGQQYEVKVPNNIADVKQTGPNSYDVKVNHDAAKKIEIKPLPPKE